MPFRRFFEARGSRHPVIYSAAVVMAGMLVSMVIAVAISVEASNRAVASSIERQRASSEGARLAFCAVVRRMVEVYSDPVPVGETGRNAREAWSELRAIFRCD